MAFANTTKTRRRSVVEQNTYVPKKLPSYPGLEDTFKEFCTGKITGVSSGGYVDMDGKTFAKLWKDCGLVNKKFTNTSIDIIFSKVKIKGERKIEYPQFLEAVDHASKEIGMPFEQLSAKIAAVKGPKFAGTKGSTFVATSIDRPKVTEDLTLGEVVDVDGLEEVFQAFNMFGGGDPNAMPNDRYIKLCKECGVITKSYDTTAADLVFTKVKPKGERKINFKMFQDAVNVIAAQNGKGYAEMANKIVTAGGPQNSGTKADAVKFHDDKNLWSGAYGAAAFGRQAPVRKEESVPWREAVPMPGEVKGLSDIFTAFCSFGGGDPNSMDSAVYAKFCVDTGLYDYSNVKDADIVFFRAKERGSRRLQYDDWKLCLLGIGEDKGMTYDEVASIVVNSGGPKLRATQGTGFISNTEGKVRLADQERPELPPVKHVHGLEEVFQAFAIFGGGDPNAMPNDRYIKLCKECGIVDKDFDTTAADLVFTKVCPRGQRKITFEMFQDAINLIAFTKEELYVNVAKQVTDSGGPQNSGTKADAVKFHDDKNLWSGAYGAAAFGRQAPVRKEEGLAWREAVQLPADTPGLQDIFTAFCSFGGNDPSSMDSAVYAKFCVDTSLYDYANVKDADLVFFKAKEKGARRLKYDDWRLCLLGIAEDKGLAYDEIVEVVLRSGGPSNRGTKAEKVKFHDDKSLYTGARAQVFAELDAEKGS